MIVIPALDVLAGRVVRLAQGDFQRVTDYGDDPIAIAARYAEAGYGILHLVSLDGARDGTGPLLALVAAVRDHTTLRVQAGGGVRDRQTLEAVLAAGAERVVVGSLAVREPGTVLDWIAEYGTGTITVALDVRVDEEGMPHAAVHGWKEVAQDDVWGLLEGYVDAGLQHLLCTNIDRDGIAAGPDLALYRNLLLRHPCLGVQASGGVRGQADLDALTVLSVPAAIVGRAILDGALAQ